MSEVEQTSAAYDAIAADYAARWASQADPMAAARRRLAAHLPAGAWVLDAGCGPAHDTAGLRALGLRAIGLDRSRGMLAQARQREGIPLMLGDMRRLPIADGALDGLWACASFLHIPKRDSRAVLDEFRRALRPGGALYLSVKQGDGERWQLDQFGQRRFFAFYQAAELDERLAAAGFAIADRWAEADAQGRPETWLSRIAQSIVSLS
jgi:SAM-dependent methyltransferase